MEVDLGCPDDDAADAVAVVVLAPGGPTHTSGTGPPVAMVHQAVDSAVSRIRATWETWLLFGSIIVAGSLGLQSYDRVLSVVVADSVNLATLTSRMVIIQQRQDSMYRWREDANALFCSPIYPERQQQALLLGMCPPGMGITGFPQPPKTARRP